MATKTPKAIKERRRARVRSRITGTTARPRLTVFRSLRGMYAQIINDETGETLAAVHSKQVSGGDAGERTGKTAVAYLVGSELAKKAKEKGIDQVVFDRAGYVYHGRVQAVADGARDGGLTF